MAEKAGMDPLEFRLKHLKVERMKGVLKVAAGKTGKNTFYHHIQPGVNVT